jgi:hypothetical protein
MRYGCSYTSNTLSVVVAPFRNVLNSACMCSRIMVNSSPATSDCVRGLQPQRDRSPRQLGFTGRGPETSTGVLLPQPSRRGRRHAIPDSSRWCGAGVAIGPRRNRLRPDRRRSGGIAFGERRSATGATDRRQVRSRDRSRCLQAMMRHAPETPSPPSRPTRERRRAHSTPDTRGRLWRRGT